MRDTYTIGLAMVGMFCFVMAVLIAGDAVQKKIDLRNQENVVISYGR